MNRVDLGPAITQTIVVVLLFASAAASAWRDTISRWRRHDLGVRSAFVSGIAITFSVLAIGLSDELARTIGAAKWM